MTLRLRDHDLEPRSGRPLLMGVVNAKPDSFSDAVRLDDARRSGRAALAGSSPPAPT